MDGSSLYDRGMGEDRKKEEKKRELRVFKRRGRVVLFEIKAAHCRLS